MSLENVERIVNKYAELLKELHPELPESVYPHMFRRTSMLKEIMDRANPFSEYDSTNKDEFDNLTENDIIEMCGLRP